jgi:hypothetical protein
MFTHLKKYNMKIEKKNLLKALDTVKAGLSSKEQIEQGSCFIFMDNKVITFNDEVSFTYPLPDFPIVGAVHADELFALVNKINTEEIEVEVSESEIIFKAGKMKAGLTIQQEILLPVEEIGEIEKWKKLPDNFLAGLNIAMGACSRNISDPITSCVHVNKSIIEGTDSYRIAHFTLSDVLRLKAFLIPANSCSKIIKLFPEEIAQGNGWMHFKNKENAIISCRIFEEKFPDTSPFLNIDKGIQLNFPKDTLKILDKAGIFSKRDSILNESVLIKLMKNKLIISSESETGWFKEPSKIDYTGDEFEFSITPYLLKDILQDATVCTISKNKLTFVNDNWKYISVLR